MLNILAIIAVTASTQAQPFNIKTPELELRFVPRTPNQMSSFYEARGFPKNMLSIIRQQCFITVGIKNNSDTKIWLNLNNWEFSAAGQTITRENRDYWKQRWQKLEIPLSKQSTFRWTLIPETLDYLPGEHEGGNIVLPFTHGPITLTATFATGEDRQGKTITITTDKLLCAEDAK
jgi:hypothetical protein